MKTFKFSVSKEMDEDIIRFLELLPKTRRAELLRHILRFYQTQLKNDGEFFLPYVQKPLPSIATGPVPESTEYRIQMDEQLDSTLIDLLESVPRKRRSEFWRHAIRYYMSRLKEGEYFVMPEEIASGNGKKQKDPPKPKTNQEDPPDALFEFVV
jgi:hypothetical protein